MLQAFTLLNNTKLKSGLAAVHHCLKILLVIVCAIDQSSLHFSHNRRPSARQQTVPGYRSVSPAFRRSLSIRYKSASSSEQPRSRITQRHSVVFGRLHTNPRSDYSNDTHTAYVAARDCRNQVAGLGAYLSVLEIRDLWRLR
ncbi:hypothetical protein FB567DRAFT_205047 [Paraphoma chrysanthemicola]|uniref:Uncharacterized protein n=1 Tax=Paraphoma chrysanthemicola TaxID=798071 RepID=A0A8K0QUA2_9PLEO|nr:hypothetical protein FB567DRAFT_205047 [Paraphoma chrysanthemicola]